MYYTSLVRLPLQLGEIAPSPSIEYNSTKLELTVMFDRTRLENFQVGIIISVIFICFVSALPESISSHIKGLVFLIFIVGCPGIWIWAFILGPGDE